MLDKKTAVIVVALALLGTTMALGATNVIVNGSGIVTGTQPAIEAELIIGHSGSPANILVITQANNYSFNGAVNTTTIDTDGSSYVKFSGTESIKNMQYLANASKIDLNTWKLNIIYQDGTKIAYPISGHLQITT